MRLNSLKEIIRIWDTWKSVMGLQVRAFKSCKKWTPAYKYYWQWKVFWINDHPPLQKQSNKDWNTPIPLENSGPSIKDSLIFPFLAMTFNSCFHHHLWVKLVCIHIGNSSGYITQTHSRFPKWLWMFDTEWNAHRIDIFENLFDDQIQSHQHLYGCLFVAKVYFHIQWKYIYIQWKIFDI